MKGGMGNLMKQAQMMQANMQKAQDELGQIDVEGLARMGLLRSQSLANIKSKRSLLTPL